jgi:hypothetical protein
LTASDTKVPGDRVLNLDFRQLAFFATTRRKDKVRRKAYLLFLKEILFFGVGKDGVLGHEVVVSNVDE